MATTSTMTLSTMTLVSAFALAVISLPSSLSAQSNPPPRADAADPPSELPASEIDPRVIGLPIRSADNQPIGIVTNAGVGNGESLLIGEMNRPLGARRDLMAIPDNMYVNQGDYIQLTLTAIQVREKLDRNRRRK